MAGLYDRVRARGLPVRAYAGYTGDGALDSQGHPVNPAHGDRRWQGSPSTLTEFDHGEQVAPVGGWGVLPDIDGPGTLLDPDQTPGYGPGAFRTHAAPVPGWAGSYHDHEAIAELHRNSAGIHAQNFGAPLLQDFSPLESPGGIVLPMDPSGTESYGDSAQAPLQGAQRVLGGRDSVQGYGGGGSGPGGVDGHGYAAVKANRQGITGNVINAYLDPAERPFLVPQAQGSYIPTDAVQGPEPWTSGRAADGLPYHDPSAYQPAPEPATLGTPLLEATAWGW